MHNVHDVVTTNLKFWLSMRDGRLKNTNFFHAQICFMFSEFMFKDVSRIHNSI